MVIKNTGLDIIRPRQEVIQVQIPIKSQPVLDKEIHATNVTNLDIGLINVRTVKEVSMAAREEQNHMAEVAGSMVVLDKEQVLKIKSVSTVISKATGHETAQSPDVRSQMRCKVVEAIKGLNRTD